MSDQSDTASFNGDWERISDCPLESENEMDRMRKEIKKLKKEIEKKDEALKKKDEEIERNADQIGKNNEELKSVRKEKKDRENELEVLKASMKEENNNSLPMEWMRVQKEEVRKSFVKLSEQTTEIYKRIGEMEVSKVESKSSRDRKKLTEEIQRIENSCNKMSKLILRNNEEWLGKIMRHLKKSEVLINKTKGLPIDAFLGEYLLEKDEKIPCVPGNPQLPYQALTIRKAKKQGYYEGCWICVNGENRTSSMWIPDNVLRNGSRVWIEGNTLYSKSVIAYSTYQLTGTGLLMNSETSFVRL